MEKPSKSLQRKQSGKKKEYHICKKWLIGSNLVRHMRTEHGAKTEEGTSNEATA